MAKQRTPERTQCLLDIFTTAIEHNGYGFFSTANYDYEKGSAVITENAQIDPADNKTFPVDLDTIARGLGVIRKAVMKEIHEAHREPEMVLHNADTGDRLYMSPEMRKAIMLVDRTNYEDGDLDVVDALAVLECGIYGKVMYA